MYNKTHRNISLKIAKVIFVDQCHTSIWYIIYYDLQTIVWKCLPIITNIYYVVSINLTGLSRV